MSGRRTPGEVLDLACKEATGLTFSEMLAAVAERDDALGRVKAMHESLRRESERSEMAFRDRDRLAEALRRVDCCLLGSDVSRRRVIDARGLIREALDSLSNPDGET